ncbi:OmpA family protein [Caldovatus aquaticus]|uniref:OmpA family protein n=1 Tax=Caldovatus aquaticus TaxID=2865671 RepID=A0ABS7F323_9PROT|nr:OmpA family protein [Caldovatus aquaticus]MBW8269200.1 OmpA family protein [Caldovatus aquaticus]
MAAAFLLPLALLLAAAPPAAAQPRSFSCVGAERLEDDVFAVPFARGGATIEEAARSPLAAAAQLAREQPERLVCVLGHAAPDEGGATTGQRLAASRARAVAERLAAMGVERDRIRAEARHANFSPRLRRDPAAARGAVVVVLPAPVTP